MASEDGANGRGSGLLSRYFSPTLAAEAQDTAAQEINPVLAHRARAATHRVRRHSDHDGGAGASANRSGGLRRLLPSDSKSEYVPSQSPDTEVARYLESYVGVARTHASSAALPPTSRAAIKLASDQRARADEQMLADARRGALRPSLVHRPQRPPRSVAKAATQALACAPPRGRWLHALSLVRSSKDHEATTGMLHTRPSHCQPSDGASEEGARDEAREQADSGDVTRCV